MADVPTWMSADTFEYVLQFTEAHEGDTNFMYNNWPLKSPVQDVTVGVGISLRSEDDAVRPDIIRLFRVRGTGDPASPQDMRAEFRRVAALRRTPSNLYTDFRDKSPLEIPKVLMRPSLRQKMLGFWDQRGSHENFPDFATIPAQAQDALMSWNYGYRLIKAPKMCKAVKDGDYTMAARESHVGGWDARKNDAHKRLLLNAGIIVRDGLDRSQLPPLGRFKPPPMVAGKVEADLNWLFGWWTVYDGNYYYYYFGPNGFVQYIKSKPSSSSPPPPVPLNQGTYFFKNDSTMIIDWNPADGGATRETFYNARRGVSEMNATSNRYSPLYAEKI
jgi:hypothetical protein